MGGWVIPSTLITRIICIIKIGWIIRISRYPDYWISGLFGYPHYPDCPDIWIIRISGQPNPHPDNFCQHCSQMRALTSSYVMVFGDFHQIWAVACSKIPNIACIRSVATLDCFESIFHEKVVFDFLEFFFEDQKKISKFLKISLFWDFLREVLVFTSWICVRYGSTHG